MYQPFYGQSFSVALEHLKKGGAVSRTAWGLNIKAKLQVPDENSKMNLPYIYMEKTVPVDQNDINAGTKTLRFPLDLSCESILGEDWYETN